MIDNWVCYIYIYFVCMPLRRTCGLLFLLKIQLLRLALSFFWRRTKQVVTLTSDLKLSLFFRNNAFFPQVTESSPIFFFILCNTICYFFFNRGGVVILLTKLKLNPYRQITYF